MVTDTDWDLLNKRLESIERSIDMLKAMQPVKEFPTPYDGMNRTNLYRKLGEIPCVFDNMPESDKMKSMCISCPCPKCSPYALSMGSLAAAGIKQEWRNKDEAN